jgi:hypothetical protein
MKKLKIGIVGFAIGLLSLVLTVQGDATAANSPTVSPSANAQPSNTQTGSNATATPTDNTSPTPNASTGNGTKIEPLPVAIGDPKIVPLPLASGDPKIRLLGGTGSKSGNTTVSGKS